jgi:PAS domain S-box-containing protein
MESPFFQSEPEFLFRSIIDNGQDIVIIFDLDWKIMYISSAFEKATGFVFNSYIGEDYFNFFKIDRIIDFDFSNSSKFIFPIIHFFSKKVIRFESICKPIYNPKGELISYFATLREVTENKFILKDETNKSLDFNIEIDQLKTRFISVLSHELKTPLAKIQSVIDINIICEGLGDSSERSGLNKQSKMIYNQLKRLDEIISEVIILEKRKAEALKDGINEVDLKKFITQLVFTHFSDPDSEPQIKLDFCSELILLKAEETLLFQIFWNLFENSLKFTPDGFSKPILKINLYEGKINLFLIDFGVGIPEEEVSFVFDEFFKASNVKNYKGIGLGLSIVKVLVKKLGGNLSFSSLQNKGSIFTISFPNEGHHFIG